MKTKAILLSFFLLANSSAWALSDLSLEGEMDIGTEFNLLPTSTQGNTAFRLQSLKLELGVPLKDTNSIQLQIEGAEKRAVGGSNRFDLQMKEAYLEVVSPFQGLRSLKYGLIPNSWQENQRQNWDYRYVGVLGQSLTEKNGYVNYSDLGGIFFSGFAEDKGMWSIAITNGEGLANDEAGPRKDAELFAHRAGWSSMSVSLGYIYGAYDQYDGALGKKERILFQFIYQHEDGFLAGIEAMDAHDPADTFALLKMAQGVDLVQYSGTNVHGMGAAAFIRWNSGPKAQTLLRYEDLQVVVGNPEKRMKTIWGGASYQFTEDIGSMLAYNYSWFPEQYGLGSRDQSAIKFATQVNF